MWVFLSFLAAFGQAFGWALKKKALENKGINNFIAFLSFLTASLVFGVGYGVLDGPSVPPLTPRFWASLLAVVSMNVLAVWCAYRALDLAAYSLILPFMPLSALLIVPLEFLLRGVLPNFLQLVGLVTLVCGGILFAYRSFPHHASRKALLYFSITLMAYAVSSTSMAVAVQECGNPLFVAGAFHLGIAFAFLPMFILSNEGPAVRALFYQGRGQRVLMVIIAAGLVIALLENGPATVALLDANASEVFALKRTMPFFALLLGGFMFGEKVSRRHVMATVLLVIGSAMVVWYK